VISRTEARAHDVASSGGASARSLAELGAALERADVVICSTTATHAVLGRTLVEAAVAGRTRRGPLTIVDIAVPRDVEPSVAEVAGVVLRDIDDLRGVVDAGLGGRIGEVSKVEEIVASEVERFLDWESAGEVAPLRAELVARAESVRTSELARVGSRLAGLSREEAEAVDRLTRRIVAKLLHPPLEAAGSLAASKQGHVYLQVVRELFELDDEPGP
jgi:glutamyl-tRNA reductase